jgi:hypothetical protein
LKTNFEKDYDKVDWEYLLKCIHKGLCQKWCDRVNIIPRNGTLCVKINNVKGMDFFCHRGVRQGNPFSPFLLMWMPRV